MLQTKLTIRNLLIALTLGTASFSVAATNVVIQTTMGDIEVELFDEETPGTVSNFLNYVNDGDFENSIIHRSVPGFILQGGGFTFADGVLGSVPTDSTIANEFNRSNLRGTISMAKLGGDRDSATSQWFINLADNPGLDGDDGNGGGFFTVFGQVIGNGMVTADAIAALQRVNAGGALTQLPVRHFNGTVLEPNLIFSDINIIERNFSINAGINDVWANPAATGQGFYIVVFPEINMVSLAWFTYDTELPDPETVSNLGSAGHRWLTALGPINGTTVEMDIDIASGGLFETPTEIQHTDPVGSDGSIILSFTDCNSGTIEYNIPSINQSGTIPIQRIVNDNIQLCESLSPQTIQ